MAEVIDPTTLSGDRVLFGATVELVDVDTDEELIYQIVGEDEADIKLGLLSITSPVAKGLIGKEEGDVAKIKTPNGVRELEILAVAFVQGPPQT